MPDSLREGTTIARYRVVSSLGAGGMGEVYRAIDDLLERPVALKILPPDVVKNEDRVRRFEREAKSASSLSHPNIVHIYEIGRSVEPPVHFIAMELVDGLTLRAKIHQQRAGLRDLLRWLAQAADALAKAHASGIVHRDLKPDNIMVSNDGYAKVLDFGVAKLIAPRGHSDPDTRGPTVPQTTREGAVIGTVGYMSPEQAKGEPVDHRSDIFSFGCILYEAATRRRPFQATSDVDVLHQIIHDAPPPVETLNPDVPAGLVRVIRRCLEKQPDKRLQSMKDLALELNDIAQPTAEIARPSGRSARKAIAVAGAAAVVLTGATLAVWQWKERLRSAEVPPPPVQTSALKMRKLSGGGNVLDAAMSPDGKYVAYLARDPGGPKLMVRQIAFGNDVEVARLSTGCEVAEWWNFRVQFTPGGESIDYSCTDIQYRVPILGGPPAVILEPPSYVGSLSPDGKSMAFVLVDDDRNALMIGDARGANARVAFEGKGGEGVLDETPEWSPDGSKIAFVILNGPRLTPTILDVGTGRATAAAGPQWGRVLDIAWLPDSRRLVVAGKRGDSIDDNDRLYVVDPVGGEVRRIVQDLNRYVSVSLAADGSSLVAIQNNLVSTVRVISLHDPEAQAFGLPPGPDHRDGYPGITWTRDGRLLHPIQDNGVRRLSISDYRTGAAQIVPSQTGEPTDDGAAVINPVSGEFVFVQMDTSGKSIWKMRSDGAGRTRLSAGPNDNTPTVSPDGEWIYYTSFTASGPRLVRRVRSTGGAPQTIFSHGQARGAAVSPDGSRVAIVVGQKIVVVSSAGGTPLQTFELAKHVSGPPDWRSGPQWVDGGRAIGWVADVRGVHNLWKQPLTGEPPSRVTNFTKGEIWSWAISPDGKWLAYAEGAALTDAVLISDFQ